MKNHFQEERAAEWAQQELEWEQQELAREMEGVEDDDGEDGEEVQEVEMGEQVVPGAMVIENYEQVQHDQQKQGHATERKSITSTGTEALHHHRHRPGSVRMEEQASRGVSLRPLVTNASTCIDGKHSPFRRAARLQSCHFAVARSCRRSRRRHCRLRIIEMLNIVFI